MADLVQVFNRFLLCRKMYRLDCSDHVISGRKLIDVHVDKKLNVWYGVTIRAMPYIWFLFRQCIRITYGVYVCVILLSGSE